MCEPTSIANCGQLAGVTSCFIFHCLQPIRFFVSLPVNIYSIGQYSVSRFNHSVHPRPPALRTSALIWSHTRTSMFLNVLKLIFALCKTLASCSPLNKVLLKRNVRPNAPTALLNWQKKKKNECSHCCSTCFIKALLSYGRTSHSRSCSLTSLTYLNKPPRGAARHRTAAAGGEEDHVTFADHTTPQKRCWKWMKKKNISLKVSLKVLISLQWFYVSKEQPKSQGFKLRVFGDEIHVQSSTTLYY